MIHLVLGKQGSGKTLYLVLKAYEFYKKGFTVYSNVHLKFPYKKLNYNDIVNCKLEKAMVIIDEVHLLLSARNSMSRINREICDSFLSMVRKKGLEVYATTQTPRKVDVRFRDESDYIYRCTKYGFIGNKWIEILHNQDLPSSIMIMIKLSIEETYSNNCISSSFHANPLFKLYDTRQIIQITGLKGK